MTDDSTTEGSTLVGIKMMAAELMASHPADGMDEVPTEQIFEAVLIQVMSVGTAVELVCRRILPTLFITCIL